MLLNLGLVVFNEISCSHLLLKHYGKESQNENDHQNADEIRPCGYL